MFEILSASSQILKSHTQSFPHIAPLLPFQFANQKSHPHSFPHHLTFKKFYVIIFKKTIFYSALSLSLLTSHLFLFLFLFFSSATISHFFYPYLSFFNRHPPHHSISHSLALYLTFIKKYVIILKKDIFYSLLTTVIAYLKSSQHHSTKEMARPITLPPAPSAL